MCRSHSVLHSTVSKPIKRHDEGPRYAGENPSCSVAMAAVLTEAYGEVQQISSSIQLTRIRHAERFDGGRSKRPVIGLVG